MIDHLNPWLDRWAAWSIAQKERLGYAGSSPVHRMMTENAATTTKKNHRAKRFMLVLGEGVNVCLVKRDIEPMRCVETQSRRPESSYFTDPACEMMDRAFAQLREPQYQDAIRLKYKSKFNNETSAKMMEISPAAYKSLINLAHESLDTYLRVAFPDQYGKVVKDMIALCGGKKPIS